MKPAATFLQVSDQEILKLLRLVVKHGDHDQSTHNPHSGGGSTPPPGQPPFSKGMEGAFAAADSLAATNWGYQHYGDWEPSEDELQAISRYTGQGYEDINQYLRTGYPGEIYSASIIEEDVRGLSAAIDNAPRVPEDVIAYRGVNSSLRYETLQPGDSIVDPAFMSTTLSPDAAFPGDAILRIAAPAGTPAAFVDSWSENEGEMELLFQQGTSMTFLGSEPGNLNGRQVLYVDVKVDNSTVNKTWIRKASSHTSEWNSIPATTVFNSDGSIAQLGRKFVADANDFIITRRADKSAPSVTNEEILSWIALAVTKHGDHDQSTHGRGGGRDAKPYELKGTRYSERPQSPSQWAGGSATPEVKADLEELWNDSAVSIWQDTLNDPENVPRVRVSSATLGKILQDERFKTTHEVRSSRASGAAQQERYTATRSAYEGTIMGVPSDLDASEMPVYGYIRDGSGFGSVFSQGYGDFDVVLKDSVLGRTTVTAGDSLNGRSSPVWHDDVISGNVTPDQLFMAGDGSIPAQVLRVADGSRDGLTSAEAADAPSYWEAQFHGGVTLGDISHISTTRSAWEKASKTVKSLAAKKGIEVRFVD